MADDYIGNNIISTGEHPQKGKVGRVIKKILHELISIATIVASELIPWKTGRILLKGVKYFLGKNKPEQPVVQMQPVKPIINVYHLHNPTIMLSPTKADARLGNVTINIGAPYPQRIAHAPVPAKIANDDYTRAA